MSQCFTCPLVHRDLSDRVRCCGETIERAVERITALGDAAPQIAAWAPGHYENACFCGVHFIAAKGSLHCLPCAIAAAETPKVGIDLSADEQNRLDQIAAKSGLYQLLSRAGVGERQAEQITAERLGPKIGDTVRFKDAQGRQQVGVVCDPNDPGKTGTYTSPSAGVIHYRADTRNRKQRRQAQAQAR